MQRTIAVSLLVITLAAACAAATACSGEALDTSDLDPDSITGATDRNPYDEMATCLP